MNSDIYSKTEKLCENYLRDDISLKDFQFQLETVLGSFDAMNKTDVEELRKIINQLEIIIYTTPESSQINEVNQLIPKIFRYVENKMTNPS